MLLLYINTHADSLNGLLLYCMGRVQSEVFGGFLGVLEAEGGREDNGRSGSRLVESGEGCSGEVCCSDLSEGVSV